MQQVHIHLPLFFSTFHSLKMPSKLLYSRCEGRHRMISPRRPSASVRPFSSSAFSAYSIVIRQTASTARDTCVCCAPCGEPGDRAARRGPATLGGEIAGAACVKGVARSPRTRRRRISRMLSVSAMWVRTNLWRSVGDPTVEFATQPSNTVQIVGACIRFRQRDKLP